MAGQPGQDVAGVLFAAPARRQRRRALQPQPPVAPRQFQNDFRGAIRRMVVEYDDFEVETTIGQRRLQRGADVVFLVSRGNQDRNAAATGARRRLLEVRNRSRSLLASAVA